MKQKQMSPDRAKQVATTRARYGDDYYKKIGQKSSTHKNPEIGRRGAYKRWHPEWFDENGVQIKFPKEEE